MIPFLDLGAATAELRPQIDAAVARVLGSGRYLLGPETAAFEEEYARACGAARCVTVGSGLDALELSLRALGVGPGDEVLVPSHTFVATWLAVLAAGAVPVPVEPADAWSGIDADAVAAACGPRTAAVVPVHMHGHPADVAGIARVAARHGLAVVEDAAQAHGALDGGEPLGRHADAVAYSFYPGKNLGALGDGGAVVTDDPAVADRVVALRSYGSPRKHEHLVVGRNSRLDEIQAAVLRTKLPLLPAWDARRREVAALYDARLGGLAADGLELPRTRPGTQPSWHLYSVLVPARDAVRDALARAGVETLVHYPAPPHLLPALRHLGHAPGSLPVSERIAQRTLSLPMGPHLGTARAAQVADAVVDAVAASARAA